MAADRIALHYRRDLNAEGASIPGVPLRDLTQADLDDLPERLLAEVKASRLYTVRPAPKAADAAEEGPTDG